MNKYRASSLALLASLGLALVITYNYPFVSFVVDSHVTFYNELFHVVNTQEDNYMEDYIQNILFERFKVILIAQGHVNSDGSLSDSVVIHHVSFSTDKEYMRAHYTVDGENYDFFTRFPWKSMPQRKYEEHCLIPKRHPILDSL